MNRGAFISEHDENRIYGCDYFLDPNRWKEYPNEIKKVLKDEEWSEYIKYLDKNGNLSSMIDSLPDTEGGFYIFFIQGQTLPSSEMYLAYIGRAQCTDNQNIRKRVKRYLWESKQEDGRPKIKQLFRNWKDFLYIKYFHTQNNKLIERGEKELIRAILPPFNDEIPDSIDFKKPQKAF